MATGTEVGGAPRLNHGLHGAFALAAAFLSTSIDQERIRSARLLHIFNLFALFARKGEADRGVDGLGEPNALYERLEDYCRREAHKYEEADLRPVVQVHLVGTLGFDAGSLDSAYMEELIGKYFRPLHARVDNNTNDQDYVSEGDDIDGRDRSTWHELERRIFEELLSRDSRYLPAKEQWSVVLAELKQMALQKEDPEGIAQYLREKRANLLR